ncbi:dienelactone hydrolase family protein [Maricaulis sp.]|uniref:dienelactone hydrolase family protein n=1 Tax=Maricaulis sp. TaxID=1486257 RepID=UPI0026151D80|nr:dienelactone hydrolase family protein [Maricaulis sp.]
MTLPRWILWAVSPLLVVLLGLSGCAVGNATGWTMPKRSLDAQVALIEPSTRVYLPENTTEPVPALIMFHGCGGLRQLQDDYAAVALEAGYAVLNVGSNEARGIGRLGAMTQVCTAQRLWGQERAADVRAAIALAAQYPGIDSDRLALIGWSHGGWTILDALSFSAENRAAPALTGTAPGLPGVRLAIAFYPYCGVLSRHDSKGLPDTIPVHAILSGSDQVVPTQACVDVLDRARSAGQPVDYEVWDGLSHAFDEPNPPNDPRIRYDAEAAARAHAHVTALLDRYLDAAAGPET